MPDRTAVDVECLVTRPRFRHLRLITELTRGGSLRSAVQALICRGGADNPRVALLRDALR